MVSVLNSPIFTSFSHSPSHRAFHEASAELNGVGLDGTSEAESQEYYSHAEEDGAEAEYNGAATGLLDAYGASPPSHRSRQTAEKQRPSRAEAKGHKRADVDEEQETREMLAELQPHTDEQKEGGKAAVQDVATPGAARGGRGAADEKEQAIQSTARAGKRVSSSLLATATSVSRGRGKQATASRGNGSGTRQTADDDDGLSMASVQQAEEQKETHSVRPASLQLERERAVNVANDADPFAFGGPPTSEQHEEQEQPAPAKKSKKSAGAGGAKKANGQKADKRKANSEEDASGAESFCSERASEKQQDAKRDGAANREKAEQESIQQDAPTKATSRSRKSLITTVSKAAAEAAAAAMRLESAGDILDFPAATQAEAKALSSEPAASKKKTAAASKKKTEKGGQRARRQKEDTQAAVEADGAVDEVMDGGDTEDMSAAERTAAHLDGYSASPPSAAWLKKKAAKERPRKAKQEALQDKHHMDDGEQQTDAEMADGVAEQQDELVEAVMEEVEVPLQVKSEAKKRKKRGEKSALPTKKKVVASNSKKKGGGAAKHRQEDEEQQREDDQERVEADGVDEQEPQEEAADEQEQDVDRDEQHVQWDDQVEDEMEQQRPYSDGEVAEEEPEAQQSDVPELDVYDFSSSGADEQPKLTTRNKQSTAAGKRAESAVRQRGRKDSKKAGTAGSSKRRKASSCSSEAEDMSDVFDATAREIGLQRDNYEDDTRSPAFAEQADETLDDDVDLSEPVVLTPPAKKRRSGHSRAPAVAIDGHAATDMDSSDPEAAVAATIQAYYQQVNSDVQTLADKAHTAHQQHTKEISGIQAELLKSPHSRTKQHILPLALLLANSHCSTVHEVYVCAGARTATRRRSCRSLLVERFVSYARSRQPTVALSDTSLAQAYRCCFYPYAQNAWRAVMRCRSWWWA